MRQHSGADVAQTGTDQRILAVDHDPSAGAALARQLALHLGARTDKAATAAEALAIVESRRFDLLLVDVLLPDIGGRELCRMLRERGVAAPIVMLGASGCEDDAILALDAGANDFVARPYHMGLLLARLRAHLRQFERSEHAVLEIAGHVFDCSRRSLTETATGRRTTLTAKEAALLRYLYLNRDRPVCLAAIMRDVWGYRADVETHTAETHIYRLRRKLEPDPGRPRILVRVAGGYRLRRAGDHGPTGSPPRSGELQPSRAEAGTLAAKLAAAICLPLLLVLGGSLFNSWAAPAHAALRSPRFDLAGQMRIPAPRRGW